MRIKTECVLNDIDVASSNKQRWFCPEGTVGDVTFVYDDGDINILVPAMAHDTASEGMVTFRVSGSAVVAV